MGGMLEISYKNYWRNGLTPRNWKVPELKWWLCRGDPNKSVWWEREGHLWDALCFQPGSGARQVWDPSGIAACVDRWEGKCTVYSHTIVPHPRADLRGNKRPHIEILTAFRETHEHSSNICTVFPYWKKSRGVLSVYYTSLKDSKCDPGY